jgi:transposase
MRGHDEHQEGMFSYISTEKRIPADHPLRRVRELTDKALQEMSLRFSDLYSRHGRPSIAPEKLLRALLLQALYSVRSERLLMEQLNYNLLFRWFVGLNVDDEVWDVTVFTKNRERLLQGEIAELFFEAVLTQAEEQRLLSDEHFTVDGTLIEAWANRRSFHEKKDPPAKGSGTRGRRMLRDTHESSSDPESRLYKKSGAGEARPSYLGHVVMENRNGLIVQPCVTESGRREEWEAALKMLECVAQRQRVQGKSGARTIGADKGYQDKNFIDGLRAHGWTPHIAEFRKETPQWPNWLKPNEREDSGFAVSQRKRKLVEKIFGWIKFVAGLRKTKFRGRRRVHLAFCLAATAANLIRMAKLLTAPGELVMN